MSKMEIAVLKALENKNIQERNVEILNTLKPSMKILIKKLKLNTRLNSNEDLLQEAGIVILKVLSKNILHTVKCAKSTYLLSAVRNGVKKINKKEFAYKRLAQANSISLEYTIQGDRRIKNLIDLPEGKITENEVLNKLISKNEIINIRKQLSERENKILDLLIEGNTHTQIARKMQLNLPAASAIIQRKIKPLFVKNAKVE